MGLKEAARRRGNCERAKVSTWITDTEIISDFEKGSLIGGLLIAASFGAMFLWAGVMW